MVYCTECGTPLRGGEHVHPDNVSAVDRPQNWGWPAAIAALAVLALVVGALALFRPVGISEEELGELLTERLAAVAAQQDVDALTERSDQLGRDGDELAAAVARLEAVVDAPKPPSVAEIADRAMDSVVTVVTPRGLGTGFAIADPTGDIYVITNYHVVERVWVSGGREVEITYGDRELTGRIVNVSVMHDLAAIGPVTSVEPLETSRDLPIVGDDIVVIGSPYGLDGTVVTGIVSAHRDERIQFSAPVSPGNSGGPLIDANGVVVGVVVEKVNTQEAEGLSFAIPMDVACRVIVAC